MKDVVVGLDGSEFSRMALRWAVSVAIAADAPVRAVQSWMYPRSSVLPGGPSPLPPAAEMDDLTRDDVAAIAAEAGGPSHEVTCQALRGPAAAALLQTVTPDSVLVLGSRGRGGFAVLLLGSVSQECVEYAPCPVVIVRADRLLASGDEILVGKDGSGGARGALEWARDLAGLTGAQVRSVHAWQPTMSERPPRIAERMQSDAARTVRGWTDRVSEEIESHEIEGDPRDVLVTAADRFGSALTVVGRRGAGGLRSMRLGSTANHLVRYCPSNVAVVPTAGTPTTDRS